MIILTIINLISYIVLFYLAFFRGDQKQKSTLDTLEKLIIYLEQTLNNYDNSFKEINKIELYQNSEIRQLKHAIVETQVFLMDQIVYKEEE